MRFTPKTTMLTLLAALCVQPVCAQFSSGSTGADGAYSPTVSGDFDPAPYKNSVGNNIFNFTTINIPQGVTIKLRASKLQNNAVTWLATGNVTIAGTLDLSGAPGATLNTDLAAQLASSRVLPEPGPGGYTGGLGSRAGFPPQSGAGPGGGPAGLQSNASLACRGGSGSFITSGGVNQGIHAGPTYGSYLLVPLYGGSGGGGGWDSASGANVGGIGGAGGGAIRIVSSTQIAIPSPGTINATGGSAGTAGGSTAGCEAGSGAGGAIHLIAPAISGNGSLLVYSGFSDNIGNINNGIIRFSTNSNGFNGATSSAPIVAGPLYIPPPNSSLAAPTFSITQVNGISVPPTAAGQYLNPDVTINAPGAVTVSIAAVNIPPGTAVTLRVTSENGPDSEIPCSALAGTVAASTATCSATFPFSISIAGARASW